MQLIHSLDTIEHRSCRQTQIRYEFLASTSSSTSSYRRIIFSTDRAIDKGHEGSHLCACTLANLQSESKDGDDTFIEDEYDELDEYTEIAVSTSMAHDHLPDKYYEVLRQLLGSYYAQK
jgi:hypothetical protein